MLEEYEKTIGKRSKNMQGESSVWRDFQEEVRNQTKLPVFLHTNTLEQEEILRLFKQDQIDGISGRMISQLHLNIWN